MFRLSVFLAVAAPYLWQCSFEVGDAVAFCDMEQDLRDSSGANWRLWSRATPSADTGPSTAYNGDFYLYFEASSPRQEGDEAR